MTAATRLWRNVARLSGLRVDFKTVDMDHLKTNGEIQ
jgi:hypothetical protein